MGRERTGSRPRRKRKSERQTGRKAQEAGCCGTRQTQGTVKPQPPTEKKDKTVNDMRAQSSQPRKGRVGKDQQHQGDFNTPLGHQTNNSLNLRKPKEDVEAVGRRTPRKDASTRRRCSRTAGEKVEDSRPDPHGCWRGEP